jgi:PIN domain nuclease of toxin-antitoxin system
MTSLLLDTHTMLWFFWDDPQLSIFDQYGINQLW